jgi:hypothetical protein
MDRSLYEYCDLTDDEILERERRLDAERAADADKERKRMEKGRNFWWAGGMG